MVSDCFRPHSSLDYGGRCQHEASQQVTSNTPDTNEMLGILKLIFKENEIEEWSEFPTTRSTTPGTSVWSKYKQFPSLGVGWLISWEYPNRFTKTNAAILWWPVESGLQQNKRKIFYPIPRDNHTIDHEDEDYG